MPKQKEKRKSEKIIFSVLIVMSPWCQHGTALTHNQNMLVNTCLNWWFWSKREPFVRVFLIPYPWRNVFEFLKGGNSHLIFHKCLLSCTWKKEIHLISTYGFSDLFSHWGHYDIIKQWGRKAWRGLQIITEPLEWLVTGFSSSEEQEVDVIHFCVLIHSHTHHMQTDRPQKTQHLFLSSISLFVFLKSSIIRKFEQMPYWKIFKYKYKSHIKQCLPSRWKCR